MWTTPIRRLRLVGVLEGISYLVLLGIAMPLKYFAGYPQAVEVTGAIHGGLFILFLIFVAEVMFRRRWWSIGFVAVSLLASVVPCGTFVYDAWLKRFDDPPATSEPSEAT
jgi:integral membrane protein